MNREQRRDKRIPKCEHPKVIPAFDAEKAKTMTSSEIRKTYPRFGGKCPDCEYQGIIYASMTHYIAGDW